MYAHIYVLILDACIHVRAHLAQIILSNDELKQSLPTMLAKLDWQRDNKGKRPLTQSLRDDFKQLHSVAASSMLCTMSVPINVQPHIYLAHSLSIERMCFVSVEKVLEKSLGEVMTAVTLENILEKREVMTAVTLENILRVMQRETLHSIISHLEKYTSNLLSSSAFAPQLSRSYKPQPTSPPSFPLDADTKPGETNANKYLVQHRDLLSSEAQTGWEYHVVLGTSRRAPLMGNANRGFAVVAYPFNAPVVSINNFVCVCVCVCVLCFFVCVIVFCGVLVSSQQASGPLAPRHTTR
jgi:hypothetical protein